MFARLLIAAIAIPLLELALLAQLSQHLGLGSTIAVVLVTGFVGVSIAKWQGRQAWLQIHRQMSAGQSPSRQILDGALILLAGIFLITPGLLTDFAGLCLLIPGLRRTLGRQLLNWFLSETANSFRNSAWVAEIKVEGQHDFGPVDSDRAQVRVIDPATPQINVINVKNPQDDA